MAHPNPEMLGTKYSIQKLDNFVSIELAKKQQREGINLNHVPKYKAFDIEMEEFDMVDDHFSDQSRP